MRFLSAGVLLTVGALAHDGDDLARIDCETGHVDPALAGGSLYNDAKCIQTCKSACASVKNERDLEMCLLHKDLDGCLFDLTKEHEADTDSCVVRSPGVAPTIVLSVEAEEIMEMRDGRNVKAVMLKAELNDPVGAHACANKGLSIGVATQASTDDAYCKWTGTATLESSYTVQDQYLTVDITQLFANAYQTPQPLALFATFKDASCGALSFRDTDVAFAVRYQDGFRPSMTCKQQGNCHDCEVNGCTWCNWSGRGMNDLPDFLPDWDFAEGARDRRQGQCGVNSAVCEQTQGLLERGCSSGGGIPVVATTPSVGGATDGGAILATTGAQYPSVTDGGYPIPPEHGGDASGAAASLLSVTAVVLTLISL